MKNGQFKSKIKIAKKMRKTTLQAHWKCSMQKTVRENSQCWKNETILKIGKNGRHAKAIAFAKWSVLGEKFQVPKTCEKILYEHIRVVPCKKQLEKLVNIIEMRRF